MSVGDARAHTGDLQESWNGGGTSEDDFVQDGVGEDHEGRFACLGGFRFSPGAEFGFEGFLFGCVGGGSLFALDFQRGFGWFAGHG